MLMSTCKDFEAFRLWSKTLIIDHLQQGPLVDFQEFQSVQQHREEIWHLPNLQLQFTSSIS